MTREALVSVSPEEVLGLAKSFFTGEESGLSASLIEEGESFIRLQTFRGLLAVSASRENGMTRVRCSTLRYHSSIGQFLLLLQTQSSATGA